jgi:transposase-like protein
MLKVVPEAADQAGDAAVPGSLLDVLARDGARRMLAAALEAEVAEYLAAHGEVRDAHGRRLVVRNGHHEAREVLTVAGAVQVRAPRVNDERVDEQTGERRRFTSVILPPWCRKSPKIEEVLPLLYLHGLSGLDFVPAPEGFLGTGAGLSAATITRLTQTCKDECKACAARDLSGVDYVYLWAEGIHVNVGLEEHKLCLLVLIGVRADGTKELVALADGHRESVESWADLLRDARRRGMRAPVLAIGDGALGFWGALREVFPETREQRCWLHKIGNVPAAMAKSAHPGGQEGPGRDLERRGQGQGRHRSQGVRRHLRREVPQGRREDHRGPRRAAGLLRLPRRALGASAHDQPDRVDLRHRPAPHEGHQGPGLPRRGASDGVQAHPGHRAPPACGQRRAARATGTSRCGVQGRQARRTTCRTN